MGRCDRVSRINSLSPCTMRTPRFTRCSEGKPRRRLLVVAKANVEMGVVGLHDTSPYVSRERGHARL